MNNKKVAIMQPYAFPYIGYFQLIQAVDTFVFYDDVNFIKGGWINRNKILINGKESLFTIPLNEASSFKTINEITINYQSKQFLKILKSIEQAYAKAPNFHKLYPLIKDLFLNYSNQTISTFAIQSVKKIYEYLEISKEILIASIDFPHTKGLERNLRLIEICKGIGASTYINAIGGQELYTKEEFLQHNIELQFIKSNPILYKQFNNEFVPWLSILDVLMFNDKQVVINFFKDYQLK